MKRPKARGNEGRVHTTMNHPSSLGCFGPLSNCPLSNLVRAGGEEASEVEHLSHGDDDFGQSRLGREFFAFFVGLGLGAESSESLFEANGQRDDRISRGVFLDPFGNLRQVFVLLSNVVLFAQIDQVHDRLCCEQEEWIDDLDLFLRNQ